MFSFLFKPRKLFAERKARISMPKFGNFSGAYCNMEKKILTSSLDLCAPTKLAQITVLEATKIKQKSSMTDGVDQNGAPMKNVKRSQQ